MESLYRDGTGPGLPYPTEVQPPRVSTAKPKPQPFGRAGRLVMCALVIVVAFVGIFIALSHVNITPSPTPKPNTSCGYVSYKGGQPQTVCLNH